jgi:4a-hydroxytetrahydrobiopterin dehydratase
MTTSDLRLLSISEINEALSKLQKWDLEDNGKSIAKNSEFKDFKEAIGFVNRVAEIAEAEGHHPDIRLYDYNKAEIKMSTHAVGGLTQKDFKIASEIDKIK